MKKLIFKNIFYPYFLRRDGFSEGGKCLRNFGRLQNLSRSELERCQLEKLIKLVQYAYDNTEYYRKIFDKICFRPEMLQGLADIKKIPILTKKAIGQYNQSLISNKVAQSTLVRSSSGGTTGVTTDFCLTKDSILSKIAAVSHFDRAAGWEYGEWMSLVWPATLDYQNKKSFKSKIRNYLSSRQVALYAIELNDSVMAQHVADIKRFNVRFIRAFPTPLLGLAAYVERTSAQLPDIMGIVTTGEILCDDDKQFIAKVFKCPVYNSYRTREVGLVAQECSRQNGMHINVENVFVEIEEKENGQKQILLTDLTNFAMPFIRYQIGDIGEIVGSECSCGCHSPRLITLGGRIADVTYTPEGKCVPSITLIPNVVHASGIKNRVQIIQDTYLEFRILIEGTCSDQDMLSIQIRNMKKIYGDQVQVTHEFVEKIPFLDSGKYQFIKCNIISKP